MQVVCPVCACVYCVCVRLHVYAYLQCIHVCGVCLCVCVCVCMHWNSVYIYIYLCVWLCVSGSRECSKSVKPPAMTQTHTHTHILHSVFLCVHEYWASELQTEWELGTEREREREDPVIEVFRVSHTIISTLECICYTLRLLMMSSTLDHIVSTFHFISLPFPWIWKKRQRDICDTASPCFNVTLNVKNNYCKRHHHHFSYFHISWQLSTFLSNSILYLHMTAA